MANLKSSSCLRERSFRRANSFRCADSFRSADSSLAVGSTRDRGFAHGMGSAHDMGSTHDMGSSRGAIYIEFIIVFPLLFFFVIAVFEYGNALKTKEALSFLVREGASISFRECMPYLDLDNEARENMEECLSFWRTRIEDLGSELLEQEVDILLAIYETDAGAGVRLAAAPPAGATTGEGFSTRFCLNTDLAGFCTNRTNLDSGDWSAMISASGRVVISEANLQYFPTFVRFLGFLDLPAILEFHESAII